MIIFLNFAPINYFGGAERKIYELYSAVKKKEDAILITVGKSIANFYSKHVLNLLFDDRLEKKDKIDDFTELNFRSFVPFTSDNIKARKLFLKSKLIYFKADFNEILILLYFGGIKIFSKSIAGIRSPWIYPSPISKFDYLHNIIFKSIFINYILKKTYKIHVLNSRDYNYLKKIGIKNVVLIPNYSEIPSNHLSRFQVNKLNIIFVGELIKRKGIDIVIDVIKNSPMNYNFSIVGKGPWEKDIIKIEKKFSNVKYFGYLNKNELNKLYARNDVLLFPSRAEGFGGVIVESMSNGLIILDSPEIHLGINTDFEFKAEFNEPEYYIQKLSMILNLKKNNKIDRNKIKKFFLNNYSEPIIMKILLKKLFLINYE